MNRVITAATAALKIQDAGNKIFGVTFRKVNGTLRTMQCRRKVSKGVSGAGMNHRPADHGNVIVYDMAPRDGTNGPRKGFRTIKVDNLTRLRMNGVTYTVKG